MRFIILLSLFFHTFLFAIESKQVLILNSYHKGFDFSDTIVNSIEKEFYSYDNIDFNVLYMDSKKIHSRDYIDQLSKLYSIQLKNRSYDLIIAIDSFAYNLAIKNFNTIANSPILFVGIEAFSKELIRTYNLGSKVHGSILQHPIKENIELILEFIPNLKKLYILNDRSPSGNETSPLIIKIINDIKAKIEIEYIRDDSLRELSEYFNIAKANEAILFIRYTNNHNGEYYKTNEIATAIQDFKLPVFVTNDLFLGKGALGGSVIPIHQLGQTTARKAIELLKNEPKKSQITLHNDFSNIFDYQQLNRFGLKVPKNVYYPTIINKPRSFFEEYRTFINFVFLVSPFLLVIIVWLLRSLYEKQQNSKELQQRIEFDKTLLNAIESPIFWQDEEGIILDVNLQFCELLDIRYEDIVNNKMSVFNQSLSNAKIVKALQDLKRGELQDSQLQIKNTQGENKTYLIHQAIYSSDTSSGTVTIFTDITKEKEIEEQKVKHTQYMIQQTKLAEIGEIFSSIAHQWKSPLVEITALAQDLFFSSDQTQKEEDSYHINNIMIQSKYMTDTINDFQDFIMPSKQKSVFNIHTTISSMLNIVRHNMKYNYINVTINVEKNTKLNVFGYENEFMQAILNIINNAKDALLINNEKNRNITIDLYNKNQQLIIDIIDNGPGISKESVNKIFIQYYSTKEKGHGIGLYMTQLIIQDKLGGKISYKKINDGSCFRIKLPIHQDKK